MIKSRMANMRSRYDANAPLRDPDSNHYKHQQTDQMHQDIRNHPHPVNRSPTLSAIFNHCCYQTRQALGKHVCKDINHSSCYIKKMGKTRLGCEL